MKKKENVYLNGEVLENGRKADTGGTAVALGKKRERRERETRR